MASCASFKYSFKYSFRELESSITNSLLYNALAQWFLKTHRANNYNKFVSPKMCFIARRF